MMTLSVSCSSLYNNNQVVSSKNPNPHQNRIFSRVSSQLQQQSKHQQFSSLSYNPLRVMVMSKKGRGFGAVCYSAPPLTPRNLQWVSTVATAVLMLAKGTAIHKSFLVPLFALQAPASIVSWMKGEYGIWTAFLALVVRLFFFIPGGFSFSAHSYVHNPVKASRTFFLGVGVAIYIVDVGYCVSLSDYEAERLIWLSNILRAGSLGKAFDQGSILATLATICIVAVPCLLLI
ncbi:hypothetical protein DH2020_042139 [Rehmannia glutinosa]|uniref:Uncharacterized protein n=1 Tax=Rehmannia glutinosa TaxID=99300 RepID=A0ABR0UPD0_REHGL